MPPEELEIFGEWAEGTREGAFDDQLTLLETPALAPGVAGTIRKRDGRVVPFETAKIAGAIYHASRSVGETDALLAQSLASGVTLYLAKNADDKMATVEAVREAIERVLAEMGHVRAAVAFAQHHEKRRRMRHLREKSAAQSKAIPLVTEDEIRQADCTLLVHTGKDSLVPWDKRKIVEALVRETSLDDVKACQIADDVEDDFMKRSSGLVTTSLIREHVGVKLIEHGLESQRERHRRIGVPLYDAQHIIQGTHEDHTGPMNPRATDRFLAQRVKREFALSHVYTQSVADAHLGGDIHLYGLGAIDRFAYMNLALEAARRLEGGYHGRASGDSDHAALMEKATELTTALGPYVSEGLALDAFNLHSAPYLDPLDEKALRQAAEAIADQFWTHDAAVLGDMPPVQIRIAWSVPNYLREAIDIGTGKPYAEFSETAKRFAAALLHALDETRDHEGKFSERNAAIVLSSESFQIHGGGAALQRAVEQAAIQGGVPFVFDRGDPLLPHTDDTFGPRYTVAARTALNLPRAAYRASNERGLERELDGLLEHAVSAHVQKRDFLARLLALRDAGPLAKLAAQSDGRPFVNLHASQFLVELCGLNECVEYLKGKDADENAAFGEHIVRHIAERCREWSQAHDMVILPASCADETASRRFAWADVQNFPHQAHSMVMEDSANSTVYYTPGVALGEKAGISPMERIRTEGRFHWHLGGEALTRLLKLDATLAPGSVADFIETVFRTTASRGFIFESPEGPFR